MAFLLIAALLPIHGLFAFWADASGDGVPDSWVDPANGEVFTLEDLNAISWDIDGDGLSNSSELSIGTNPFQADTDGDGIADAVDPVPLDAYNDSPYNGLAWGGDALGDSDGDGIANFNDAYPYDNYNGNNPNSDSDGDGIPNAADPAPSDSANYSEYNWTYWYGDALADFDGDGVDNFHDTYPYDSTNGSYTPPESQNYSDANGVYWYGDAWNDADGDGIQNYYDAYPYDYYNGNYSPPEDPHNSDINGISWYGDAYNDADGDGIQNYYDPYPYDPYNGSPPINQDPDYDGDGIPDYADPSPWDYSNFSSANNTTWNGDALGDFDGDGIANFYDQWPYDPYNGYTPVSDMDGDGIADSEDPAPEDPTNTSPINGVAWFTSALADADGDGNPNFTDPWPYDPYNGNPPPPANPDIDEDGIPDVFDPAPGDPSNTSSVNWMSWYGDALGDFDGDGVLNFYDQWPYDSTNGSYNPDPNYNPNPDSDGDGIPDASDPAPNDSWNYSSYNSTSWYGNALDDSDGDGTQNFFDAYPFDPYNGNPPPDTNPNPDSDGDGIPDSSDPASNDSANTSLINGVSWYGNIWGDDDGDGVQNFWDSQPYGEPQVDSDGDGLLDNVDPSPGDPNNYSPFNNTSWLSDALGDADGDGVANFFDFWPYDRFNGTDDDGDGIPNSSDTAPGDSMNYSPHNGRDWYGDEVLGDMDNDGVLNFFDVYPEDPYNGNPPTYVVDSDGDGMPDSIDPSPNDPSNTSPVNGISWGWGDDALGDADGDGVSNYSDEYPYEGPDLDSDGDGMPDSIDPARLDPDNLSPNNGRKWPGWKALEDWNDNGIPNFYDPDPESGPTIPFTVTNPGAYMWSSFVFLNDDFDEEKSEQDESGELVRIPDSKDVNITSAAPDGGGRVVVDDMIPLVVAPVAIASPYNFTFNVKIKVVRADGTNGQARLHMISHAGKPDQVVSSFSVGEECEAQLPVFGIMNAMLNLDTGPQFWVEGVSPGKFKIEVAYDAIDLPSGFIWDGYNIFEYYPEYSHHEPVSSSVNFEVLEPFLMADVDRDGIIDPIKDVAALAAAHCLRHWINDDSDSGEAGDAGYQDVPGSATTVGMENGHVDGSRDLVDFFPVLVRLPPVQFGAISKIRLRNIDGAFNVVLTSLGRGNARDYLKTPGLSGCGLSSDGSSGNEDAASALTRKVTSTGLEIPLKYFDGKPEREAVLLVEASMETSSPLELVIEFVGGQEAKCSIPMSISGVEKMFRHVDLTGLAKEYDGSPITPPVATQGHDTGAPSGLPDSETNGKYFVFVHGYNVNGQKARGWNAEVFKRLHALGSKARFVGVTWNGTPHTNIPSFITDNYPDYHKAVFQAFQTGDGLAAALSFMQGADVTVAAHSLGNMVVSHAVQSGGFRPARYYLINAAVPLEAYDLAGVSSDQRANMTENDWKNRDRRFFASNWHERFEDYDFRSKLKWKNAFESVVGRTAVCNFYSQGEDVLGNTDTDTAATLVTAWNQNFDFNRGAWKSQELLKGVNFTTSLGDLVMERGQAGWNADLLAYRDIPDAQIPSGQLKTKPYFKPFLESILLDENVIVDDPADGLPEKIKYDILARGIPALSYAAGQNAIGAFGDGANFDMEADGRVSGKWPAEGHAENYRLGKWIHSDVKNVALPYVAPMYQTMIGRGALNSL